MSVKQLILEILSDGQSLDAFQITDAVWDKMDKALVDRTGQPTIREVRRNLEELAASGQIVFTQVFTQTFYSLNSEDQVV